MLKHPELDLPPPITAMPPRRYRRVSIWRRFQWYSVLATGAIVVAAFVLAKAQAAEDPRNLNNPETLLSLCESSDSSEQLACKSYLLGFEDVYIWIKGSPCFPETYDSSDLEKEFVAVMRLPNVPREYTGTLLLALLDRASSQCVPTERV